MAYNLSGYVPGMSPGMPASSPYPDPFAALARNAAAARQQQAMPYVPPTGGAQPGAALPTATPGPATSGGLGPQMSEAFGQRFPIMGAIGGGMRDWASANPDTLAALGQAGSAGLLAGSQATGTGQARNMAMLGAMGAGFQEGMREAPGPEWIDIPAPDGSNQQWQRNTNTGEMRAVGSGGQLIGDVTANAGGGNDWRDNLTESVGTMLSENIDAGLTAGQRMVQLNELESLLNSVEGGTGLWAGARDLASRMGIDLAGDADEIAAARAIISSLVPEFRPPASGTFTDADAQLVKNSLPALINTPGGNALIVRTLRGIAEYEQAVGQVIMDGLEDPNVTLPDLMRSINNIPDPIAALRETEAWQQAGGNEQETEQDTGEGAAFEARPMPEGAVTATGPDGTRIWTTDGGQTWFRIP